MERRLAHPKMQKSDKIIKSCHPHQPCVYDSSGCRRSTPLKFSLDLEGNEQAKMCNLFVLRTSSREFLFLFSLPYLNNSESNVPKHLQFRAFTLIPLKKKRASQSFTWPCYHSHVHIKKGLGSFKATCIYFSRFALH